MNDLNNAEQQMLDIVDGIDFANITKHPNILIAANFWEEDRYMAARVCYRFMRTVDDMIDDRKAGTATLSCLEKELFLENVHKWIDCLTIQNPDDPSIMEITGTIEKYKIPIQLFHNFARSMIHDINHDGFKTFSEFLDYSEGASVAPASVFVHLCCLARQNGEFMPPLFNITEIARPCAIFSYLVHIIRDFQVDQLNNLNYFPLDILEKNHLSPSDLKSIARGAPVPDSFRNVIREYCGYAENYRLKTLEQLDKLPKAIEPRYLLSLHVIYNLYLQVFERIEAEKGTFTTAELNPEPNEIWQRVAEIIRKNKHLFREYSQRG
jgi:phytoene/squalene synthetase